VHEFLGSNSGYHNRVSAWHATVAVLWWRPLEIIIISWPWQNH